MAAKPDSDPLVRTNGPTPEKGKRKTPEPEMDWLPHGWSFEDRVRSSGASVGTTDRYYFDPVSHRKFRSKKEVLYFLETGTPRKKIKGETPRADATPKEKSGDEKQKPSEKKASERKLSKKKASEKKPSEKKASEKKPSEKKSSEKKPSEKKASEKTPQKPSEKVSQKPSEKKDSGVGFNFSKIPEKVQWVLSVEPGSRASWNAYIGGDQVPESSKLDWLAAFTLLASKDRDKYH